MIRRAALTLTAAVATAVVAAAIPASADSAPARVNAAAQPAAVVVGGPTPSYVAAPLTMWVSSTEIRVRRGSTTVWLSGPWTSAQLAEQDLARPTTATGTLTLYDAFGFSASADIRIIRPSVTESVAASSIVNPGSYTSSGQSIPAGPSANFVSWDLSPTGGQAGIFFVDGNVSVDGGAPSLVGTQWIKYLPAP